MKKKKIIFMIINMNIGGTEKALLNMMPELLKHDYEITILMLEKFGGFLEYIPDGVQVKYLKEYKEIKDLLNNPPQEITLKYLKEKKLLRALNQTLFHVLSKIAKDRSLYLNYLSNNIPVMKNEYDIAVAYAGPMDFISYFVVNKIKAKKKIQWVHFDITKIGFNKNFASKIYSKFDKVFVVSKEGKNKLIKMVPNIQSKVEVFSNMISKELVVKMADEGEGFNDEYKGVRILTVGRLSKEKGQDLIIPVLAKLKKDGYDLRWYCIGEGSSKGEFLQLANEYKVEDEFILLGSNANPYPFMKQCDIYVQPSRHEGYCITLSEARCFDNPIICTDFTGANEQILNYHNGLIIQFSESQLYDALKTILKDKNLRNRFKENLKKEKIETNIEMEKFYTLANDY